MNFRLMVFLVVTGFYVAFPLLANIDDDLDALRKNYGSAKYLDDTHYIFLKEGFSITVYLDEDKSAMEVFVRQNLKDSSLPPPPFTQADMRKILQQQTPEGMKWFPAKTLDGKVFWTRSDNHVVARFNTQVDADTHENLTTLVVMVNKK